MEPYPINDETICPSNDLTVPQISRRAPGYRRKEYFELSVAAAPDSSELENLLWNLLAKIAACGHHLSRFSRVLLGFLSLAGAEK